MSSSCTGIDKQVLKRRSRDRDMEVDCKKGSTSQAKKGMVVTGELTDHGALCCFGTKPAPFCDVISFLTALINSAKAVAVFMCPVSLR
jgi:hypothetical protein